MTLAEEAERSRTANNLSGYKNSIANSVTVLKSYKTDLQNIKTDMQAKTNIYSAADVTEVDDMLTDLQSQVSTI